MPPVSRPGSARARLGRVFGLLGRFFLGLWGVTLLPFLVLHLAVSGGSGGGLLVPKGDAERIRRLYGWNLPVLLNFGVRDRRERVEALLSGLRSGRFPCRQFAARAEELGTAVLPEFAEALARFQGQQRHCLADTLRKLLLRRGWPHEELADLSAWWREERGRFRQEAIHRAVREYLREGSRESADLLGRLAERAVPALVEAAFRSGGENLERATAMLSRITGRRILYVREWGGADRVRADWRRFWRAEELRYRDISAWERLAGIVTRTRYGWWLRDLLGGHLGMSSAFHRPVRSVLAERLPVTLGLGLVALLLAYGIGVPVGIWLATTRRKAMALLLDRLFLLAYGAPSYITALVLLFLLTGVWGPKLFPSGGLGSLEPGRILDLAWHAVLPVLSMALVPFCLVARYQRAAMDGELDKPYIVAVRARGVPERRIVWRHALRGGILPVVQVLGLHAPFIVGGAVVTETIFDVPGLGSAVMTALWEGDAALFMGVATLVGLVALVSMAGADLAMYWLDPRIRRPGEGKL